MEELAPVGKAGAVRREGREQAGKKPGVKRDVALDDETAAEIFK